MVLIIEKVKSAMVLAVCANYHCGLFLHGKLKFLRCPSSLTDMALAVFRLQDLYEALYVRPWPQDLTPS